MKFEWRFDQEEPMTVLQYLRLQAIPRRFISRLKYQGGDIKVNDRSVTVREELHVGDLIQLYAPIEQGHETVPASSAPIEVVYEDRDLLVVNKPVGIVSIPSRRDPDSAMANRIKGYYQDHQYQDQVIHIVTRLDRDTSGLMLIAKHRLAHAWMDQQIRHQQLKKYYYAISQRQDWPDHGYIDGPIARDPQSIITRRVDPQGQASLTEYWLQETLNDSSLLKLRLHTGRTHQIRVHLSWQGGPLIGDDLYGGRLESPLNRQALHCGQLEFVQPFSGQAMVLKQDLPADMLEWVQRKKIRRV
ncbi:23S rRNA pseudouridine1911/1915/1917 synthase [Ignavigranum ruoffiae]|uniref:Pseudouridine synthase n=1 Tax=Ignavigranum ruoffiae TaxID=89093 RepID=A0A1H9FWE8_9LACT|nr:RluA family pseudouridine synthase [Ignavigranum ruoffiae]SEQ42211.1 23S rRNA pseudouridine1911/1915/1917 synthase [Ignavigranum ruoffiae]